MQGSWQTCPVIIYWQTYNHCFTLLPDHVLQAELERLTEEEELTAEEVLLRRMDAGLYTLQQCALIIGNLWIVGDQGVKQRLLMLLHQQVCSALTQHAVLYCAVLCCVVLS